MVGRAVVGGLIMGPLGAIVGGISGTSMKDSLVVTQYVVINFWDISTKTAQSILIQCDSDQNIDGFINRQLKESKKNITENRVAEQEHTPVWMIMGVVIIVISVIVIIAVSL